MSQMTPGPYEIQIDGTMSGRGPSIVSLSVSYSDGSPVLIAEFGTSEVSNDGENWMLTDEKEEIEANADVCLLALTKEFENAAD